MYKINLISLLLTIKKKPEEKFKQVNNKTMNPTPKVILRVYKDKVLVSLRSSLTQPLYADWHTRPQHQVIELTYERSWKVLEFKAQNAMNLAVGRQVAIRYY